MGLITLLAAESGAAHAESFNYTPFYIVGGVLAVFAVALSALGMSKADFPGSTAVANGVMALCAVLAAAAMFTAVYVTS